MTAPAPVILYSRPGCHLCDHVEKLLQALAAHYRIVNIENDAELEARYGLAIPVVKMERTKKKLFFPFGEEQLACFLEGESKETG